VTVFCECDAKYLGSLTHLLLCPCKVGYALSPSRHTRMPREGMLKISGFCLPEVKRNVP
jgi:hypothetical protein